MRGTAATLCVLLLLGWSLGDACVACCSLLTHAIALVRWVCTFEFAAFWGRLDARDLCGFALMCCSGWCC